MLLERCQQPEIKLSPDQMKPSRESVEFHGHRIIREGVQADLENFRMITTIPKPGVATVLQRLDGMISYLSWFLPNPTNVMKLL